MRTLKTTICLLLTLLFASLVHADGPSIDSFGNPKTECAKIKLTSQQREEIGSRRIVTLTTSQMESISPEWGTQTIGIVSENWNDCTCGMIYGFWTEPNELSVPKRMASYEKSIRERQEKKKLTNEEAEDWDFLTMLRKSIIMDEAGNFYRGGLPLSVSKIKDEYLRTGSTVFLNVPSLKVLGIDKRNTFLKRLSDEEVEYGFFG